jgi:rubrerythrin
MKEIEKKIEQILQRAIRVEEDSYKIYQKALRIVQSESIRELLEELAGDEREHRRKLKEMLDPEQRAAMIEKSEQQKVIDLKIGDYLVPREVHPNATMQDILTVAIHREKDTHRFYKAMSAISEDEVKKLFEFLADEEIKHKNKLESIYDDVIFREF